MIGGGFLFAISSTNCSIRSKKNRATQLRKKGVPGQKDPGGRGREGAGKAQVPSYVLGRAETERKNSRHRERERTASRGKLVSGKEPEKQPMARWIR